MSPDQVPEELLQHLCYSSRLNTEEAHRLVTEVLSYYNEATETYVRRRHLELQGQGHPNKHIYRGLLHELEHRRFPAPTLSERQIRRMIYG